MSGLKSTILLHPKMCIQPKCLKSGEHGILFIDMAPSGLYHPNLFICFEMRNTAFQKIWLRHKIGIENGNEFSLGYTCTELKCSGLKSLPVLSSNMLNINSFCLPGHHLGCYKLNRFIVGIVQHLNFKLIFWPI